MVPISNLGDIDVVILCGGLGRRLKGIINDRPKAMAEINSRPFLDILIDYIAGYKFKRFILCVGYMKDVIKRYYEKRSGGLRILFSEERELLGTAGAIKNAEALIKSNPFLVMNGDSFCRINLRSFLDFHIGKKALASIALVPPEKDTDYGAVAVDSKQRLTSFNEKSIPAARGLTSAGIYFFCRDIFKFIPLRINYSLEYDLFPNLINKGNKGIYGYITKEKLVDIGTPERYKMAKDFLSRKDK